MRILSSYHLWLQALLMVTTLLFTLLTLEKVEAKILTNKVFIVYFESGSFERTGSQSWVEKRQNGQVAFYFEQQNITDTAILLYDPTREVHISLVLASNEILYSHKGKEFRTLYRITSVIKEKKNTGQPPLKCGKNYKLVKGNCILHQNCGPNAYRTVEGDCFCLKGFQQINGKCRSPRQKKKCGQNLELKNGKCVWKTDKNGFDIKPWLKPQCKGLERACNKGNNKACLNYEQECQVN